MNNSKTVYTEQLSCQHFHEPYFLINIKLNSKNLGIKSFVYIIIYYQCFKLFMFNNKFKKKKKKKKKKLTDILLNWLKFIHRNIIFNFGYQKKRVPICWRQSFNFVIKDNTSKYRCLLWNKYDIHKKKKKKKKLKK